MFIATMKSLGSLDVIVGALIDVSYCDVVKRMDLRKPPTLRNQFHGMIWRDTLLVKPVVLLKDTTPGDLTSTTLLEKVIRIKFHSLTSFLVKLLIIAL